MRGIAALVVLGLLGLASPAIAEEGASTRLANGSQIGAWTVKCEAIAVGETQCVLSQSLVRSGDDTFLVELLAFWSGDLSKRLLVARVPAGVYLPSGFVLGYGEPVEQQNFAWQQCRDKLCEALLDLDDAVLGKLDAAGTVTAGYRPGAAAEPLVFSVTVEGLADGLTQLKAALVAAAGK